ncbi:hypothetical protein C5167_042482 [Papaver somniferum]|uniref:Band 7 domain-containing protein n=1 Tax=Papaver somniferum TaxID=3469 RepID=A0A4Y7L400_PAPSO|nr:hypothetical protein C5167_042482 [Papaver somniferum]
MFVPLPDSLPSHPLGLAVGCEIASVPKILLDDVLEQKNDIAKIVEEEVEKAMSPYGYEIVQTLVVDIEPNDHEKQAMNETNAGIARQRQAIVDGIKDSVMRFSINVPGTTTNDVIDMVLATQ